MGIKGRKRRLKNFDSRAKAFEVDIAKNHVFDGVKNVCRKWSLGLGHLGIGKHRRLRYKTSDKRELYFASEAQSQLLTLIKSGELKPKNYVLAEVASNSKLGVQEYFHRPSLEALRIFLEAKAKDKKPRWMSKTDYFLCKRLLGQYKKTGQKIDLAKVKETEKEFLDHLEKHTWFKMYFSSNVIVLGLTKNGELRLALVDH